MDGGNDKRQRSLNNNNKWFKKIFQNVYYLYLPDCNYFKNSSYPRLNSQEKKWLQMLAWIWGKPTLYSFGLKVQSSESILEITVKIYLNCRYRMSLLPSNISPWHLDKICYILIQRCAYIHIHSLFIHSSLAIESTNMVSK